MIPQYKVDFIKFLVKCDALKFGEFTLKSGRKAPYFLNAGCFATGEQVYKLARFYAQSYLEMGMQTDVIFGPSYKGIPLAVSLASVLFSEFSTEVSYCFNRKEAKNYGDAKGVLVGAELNKDTEVLLIDDVITAGTAIREVLDILKENGNPKVTGVLIMLNRLEKNNDGIDAVQALEDDFGLDVHAIIDLNDVVEVLYNQEIDGKVYIDEPKMQAIQAYRSQYGV